MGFMRSGRIVAHSSIVQPSASVGQPGVTDFQAAPCRQVRLSRAEKRWCKIAAFLPNSQWSLRAMFNGSKVRARTLFEGNIPAKHVNDYPILRTSRRQLLWALGAAPLVIKTKCASLWVWTGTSAAGEIRDAMGECDAI